MLILHRKRAGIKQEKVRPLEKEEVCSERAVGSSQKLCGQHLESDHSNIFFYSE